ncbi:MAG: hypothetical protein MZV70_17760 [Desulfobacterales bacterium]|nr:hypothetical protein [Desulfobacterales bacterium]
MRDATPAKWLRSRRGSSRLRSSDWAPVDEGKVKARSNRCSIRPLQPAPGTQGRSRAEGKETSQKEAVKPAAPEPCREPVNRTIRGTGMLTMPVDPIWPRRCAELSRSNIPGALETCGTSSSRRGASSRRSSSTCVRRCTATRSRSASGRLSAARTCAPTACRARLRCLYPGGRIITVTHRGGVTPPRSKFIWEEICGKIARST